MQFLVHLLVEGGANADAELDETDAWFAERVADEPYLASAMAGNRAFRAIQRGDLDAAAAADIEAGRLDPFNSVATFSEAIVLALVARNRALVGAGRGRAPRDRLARRVGQPDAPRRRGRDRRPRRERRRRPGRRSW